VVSFTVRSRYQGSERALTTRHDRRDPNHGQTTFPGRQLNLLVELIDVWWQLGAVLTAIFAVLAVVTAYRVYSAPAPPPGDVVMVVSGKVALVWPLLSGLVANVSGILTWRSYRKRW